MVQAIPRSKARLTERQQFWLDHLRVCREQGHTLRGYAKAHGLSVSGLYTAHSTLKSRGALTDPNGPDRNVRQATVNLFADMGVQPATLAPDLVRAEASQDRELPVCQIAVSLSGSGTGCSRRSRRWNGPRSGTWLCAAGWVRAAWPGACRGRLRSGAVDGARGGVARRGGFRALGAAHGGVCVTRRPGLAAQRLHRSFAAPVRAGFEHMRRGHGFALQ